MRIRLRPKYSETDLAELYKTPHNHSKWIDHKVRVQVTLGVAALYPDIDSVADLSCGDAWIISNIQASNKYIGDFAPGYPICGPIEETIETIPPVDLFICSETIEHLDDPDLVLRSIRKKAKHLVLSTPSNEPNPSPNPEHYWGWDEKGVEKMLLDSGWKPDVFNHLQLPGYVYNFQIWGAS